MESWKVRRRAGLLWTKSPKVVDFCKYVYQTYAEIFTTVIENQYRDTLHRCLESFYLKKRVAELGVFRGKLQSLLSPLCSLCGCREDNVVDRFSFVHVLVVRAVFKYFGGQVRKTTTSTPCAPRIKDREDHAKTYYICGCVLKSVKTECKHKPNAKSLLQALSNLTVDMLTASKLGLPTRHVTLKSRGGLMFASTRYYQLMCKIEDKFYSTVCFLSHVLLPMDYVLMHVSCNRL